MQIQIQIQIQMQVWIQVQMLGMVFPLIRQGDPVPECQPRETTGNNNHIGESVLKDVIMA